MTFENKENIEICQKKSCAENGIVQNGSRNCVKVVSRKMSLNLVSKKCEKCRQIKIKKSFSLFRIIVMSSKYRNCAPNHDPAIRSLFLNELTANVHFVFQSANNPIVRVPAHKSMLVDLSKVFRSKFYGPLKEIGDVKIVDASPIAFRQFLQFFYLDEIELSIATIKDVLNLGQKYDVADCQSICEKFLIDQLTDDTVCWIYGLAITYERIELKRLCELLIGINTPEILESAGFLNCSRQVLGCILKLKSLAYCEFDVFKACMLWTRKVSKKNYLDKDTLKDWLGDSFHDIRFELMSMDEFLSIFTTYQLLFSAEKRRDIIQRIVAKDFNPKMANIRGRQCNLLTKPILDYERNVRYSEKPYFIQSTEFTTFSTNKPLLLRGVICADLFVYDGMFYDSMDDFPSEIEIFECQLDTKRRCVYSDDETELEYNCDDREHIVWLEKPIIILPGKNYEIKLKLIMDDDLCTKANFISFEEHSRTETIVTFHKTQNHSQVDSEVQTGLISGLKYSQL